MIGLLGVYTDYRASRGRKAGVLGLVYARIAVKVALGIGYLLNMVKNRAYAIVLYICNIYILNTLIKGRRGMVLFFTTKGIGGAGEKGVKKE